MRALTGQDVLVEDRVFSTLDTKTSVLKLGGGVQALLSDTVGFIRRLPHNLVASFHATLEEAREADLLLHVVDASSGLARGQIDAVNGVLTEIGAKENETIMVLNKVDAIGLDHAAENGNGSRDRSSELDYKMLRQDYPEAIPVSALRAEGLDRLKTEIRERAREGAHPLTLSVHAGDGKTLSFLATHFFEDSRENEGEWLTLKGRATRNVMRKLLTEKSSVKILEGWTEEKDEFRPAIRRQL